MAELLLCGHFSRARPLSSTVRAQRPCAADPVETPSYLAAQQGDCRKQRFPPPGTLTGDCAACIRAALHADQFMRQAAPSNPLRG